jgi:hypothetical protein
MQMQMMVEEYLVGALRNGAAAQRADAAVDDLLFLAAWERGFIPGPSAFLRIRQIRRAHPGLTLVSDWPPQATHGDDRAIGYAGTTTPNPVDLTTIPDVIWP